MLYIPVMAKRSCAVDNGGCMENCTVVGDDTVDDVCACSPGYTLSDDKESCNIDKGTLIAFVVQ